MLYNFNKHEIFHINQYFLCSFFVQKIEGELYEIDDEMLASLDEFEGHPTVYQRCYVKALTKHNSENGAMNRTIPESVECWTYFLKKFPPGLLNIPAHANYQAFGDHGRHYNPQQVVNFSHSYG